MINYIELKIKKRLKNYSIDDIIKLRTLRDGLPADLFWRARIYDSVIDDCVEIVKEDKPKKQKKVKSKDFKEDK